MNVEVEKHLNLTSLVKQESAAYATVSALQCRHMVNTFEVAAIECLTSVAT